MERVAGEHCVEALAAGIPGFEVVVGDLDLVAELGEASFGQGGQVRADLDAADVQASLEERSGCLAGPRSDLNDAVTGPQAGQLDELLEHLGRRHGSAGVVGRRVLVEGQSELFATRL